MDPQRLKLTPSFFPLGTKKRHDKSDVDKTEFEALSYQSINPLLIYYIGISLSLSF